MMEYNITPVPAPRMTRSDKWRKPPRPCVARYFAFRDQVKKLGITLEPFGQHITFYMPMPKSWSKKKKLAMDNTLHQQVPDIDNLEKAIFDSIFDNDAHIADVRVTKLWAKTGKIKIGRY